jgi:hypothetical protein
MKQQVVSGIRGRKEELMATKKKAGGLAGKLRAGGGGGLAGKLLGGGLAGKKLGGGLAGKIGRAGGGGLAGKLGQKQKEARASRRGKKAGGMGGQIGRLGGGRLTLSAKRGIRTSGGKISRGGPAKGTVRPAVGQKVLTARPKKKR